MAWGFPRHHVTGEGCGQTHERRHGVATSVTWLKFNANMADRVARRADLKVRPNTNVDNKRRYSNFVISKNYDL